MENGRSYFSTDGKMSVVGQNRALGFLITSGFISIGRVVTQGYKGDTDCFPGGRNLTHSYRKAKIQALVDLREKRVRVSGWVHRLRQQKELTFIVLRDGTGFLQCILTGKLVRGIILYLSATALIIFICSLKPTLH